MGSRPLACMPIWALGISAFEPSGFAKVSHGSLIWLNITRWHVNGWYQSDHAMSDLPPFYVLYQSTHITDHQQSWRLTSTLFRTMTQDQDSPNHGLRAISWKSAFKSTFVFKYLVFASLFHTPSCGSIVWLSISTCENTKHTDGYRSKQSKVNQWAHQKWIVTSVTPKYRRKQRFIIPSEYHGTCTRRNTLTTLGHAPFNWMPTMVKFHNSPATYIQKRDPNRSG